MRGDLDTDTFKTIVENLDQLFYIHDKNNLITYISPYCMDMFGCSPEEMQAHWMSFATDNPTNQEGKRLTQQALLTGETQKPYYLELRRRNGEIFWVEVREVPLKSEQNEVVGMVGSLTEVTDLFKQQDELRRFRLGLDLISDIVFMTDTNGVFAYINESFSRVYGYTFSDLAGKTPRILKSGKQDEEFYKHFWATLLDKKSMSVRMVNLTQDKKEIIIASEVSPIIVSGHLQGFLAVQRDITEDERLHKMIAESEERMRILAEQTGYLIYDYDLETGKIGWSGAMSNLTGHSKGEFSPTEKEWEEMVHGDDRKRVLHSLRESNEKGEKFEEEYQFLQKDGSYKWVRDSGVYITANGKPVRMLGVIVDKTHERKVENEMKNHLHELEKMVNLMINREMRMIELKNRIRELEQKLQIQGMPR